MSPIAILRIIAFYLLAVVVATILGGLVQSQIEIAALAETPLDLNERVAAGWPALRGLLPILAAILAVTLLITLPIAEALARFFSPWRCLLFALGGAGGICAAYKRLPALPLTLPSLTSPAGGWQWLALCVAVAIGSWLFGQLTRRKAKRGLRVLGLDGCAGLHAGHPGWRRALQGGTSTSSCAVLGRSRMRGVSVRSSRWCLQQSDLE